MPYRLELAKSARSKCNGPKPCGGDEMKIEKGEPRCGVLVEIMGSQTFKYRHIYCITSKIIANMKDELGDDPDDVDGVEELDDETREKFKRWYADGEVDQDDVPDSLKEKWEVNELAREHQAAVKKYQRDKDKKMRKAAEEGEEYVASPEPETPPELRAGRERLATQSIQNTPVKGAAAGANGKAKVKTPKSTEKKPKVAAAKASPSSKKKAAPKTKPKGKKAKDESEDELTPEETSEEEAEFSADETPSEDDYKPKKKGGRASTGSTRSRANGGSGRTSGKGKGKGKVEDESESEDVESETSDEGGMNTSDEEVMPVKKNRSASGPARSASTSSSRGRGRGGGQGGSERGSGRGRGRGRGTGRSSAASAVKDEPDTSHVSFAEEGPEEESRAPPAKKVKTESKKKVKQEADELAGADDSTPSLGNASASASVRVKEEPTVAEDSISSSTSTTTKRKRGRPSKA